MKKFFFRLCTSVVKSIHSRIDIKIVFLGIFLFLNLKCKKNNEVIVTIQIDYPIVTVADYPIVLCSDITRDIETAKVLIRGKWNWLQEKRAVRGVGFQDFTPLTDSIYYQFWYSNDTVFRYKNGIITDTSKFTFNREFEFDNYPPDTLPVVAFYNIHSGVRQQYVPYKICKDFLIFQYQYVTSNDGEFTYKKFFN